MQLAFADKNLGVFTGFLAGFAWKGTETFKQARPAYFCTFFYPMHTSCRCWNVGML